MISKLKSGINKLLDGISNLKLITSLGKYLPNVDKREVLFAVCMVVIIVLAVSIRILPLNWGFNLSEFDPYYQYDVTRHIVENGFFSWQNWHIDDMWFPQGRDVAYTSFPGFPMTGAAFYFIISSLGFRVSVMDVTILFPLVFAAITCILAYYVGKEVGGKGVGLLSALFLAINPAYISRTTLGFYDDETVGVFGIVITSLFFLRSLKQEKWQAGLAYSLAAGIGLGYIFASWGASRYLLSLLALFTFLLFITKNYSFRLLTSYGSLMGVGLSIAVLVPKLGIQFIREFETVAAIGVFLLLAVYELSRRFGGERVKTFMALSLAGLGVLALGLWLIGFISLPVAKFISVINPFERISMPLIESVQEHRPATWSAFYYQFGALVFLAPLGIVFTLQRPNHEKIFIVTYAVTTLYFSASLIRLTVLMAPSLCVLGALAIVEIIRPFTDIAMRRVFTRRRLRLYPTVGRTFSVFLIITLFTLTLLPLERAIDSANTPTTISASSLPFRANIDDWPQTLAWMKDNLPEHAVVVSWWDYGYWISVVGDKISLSDNGTFNATQIAWVGRMFMSTEEDAIIMIKDFNSYAKTRYNANKNISYVVVFTTLGLAFQQPNSLYGDEVKWRWMAKIGWNSTADQPLEDTSITSYLANTLFPQENPSASESLQQWYYEFSTYALPKADRVLTKLMVYGAFGFNQPEHFEPAFSSSNGLVFVYKVLY